MITIERINYRTPLFYYAVEAFIEEFREEYPFYEEWINEQENSFKKDRIIYAIKLQSRIAGLIMINKQHNYSKLNGIFVLKQFYNRSVAQKGIEEVVRKLEKDNINQLYVQIRMTNDKMKHILSKLGFKQVGYKQLKGEEKINSVYCYDLNGSEDINQKAKKIYTGFYM